MLDDYFSLEISGDGRLVSLPMVFDDHVPSFSALPGCKSHFRNKQYEEISLFKNYDFDVQTSMCFESTSASTEVLHVNINLQVYVMRLATEVNWTDEEECFRTFCEETAKFYAVQPNIPNARSGKWKI